MEFLSPGALLRLVSIWRYVHFVGRDRPWARGVELEDVVDGAKGDCAMTYDQKDIGIGRDESGEPQLMWKAALILLCLGIFALVMWSGSNDPAQRCTQTDPAEQQACVHFLNAQAPERPAKGPFPLVHRSAERSAD
jgi:hypothetical protein